MSPRADIQGFIDCADTDPNDLGPICLFAVDRRAAAAAKQTLLSGRRFISGKQFLTLGDLERRRFDRCIRCQRTTLGLAAHLAVANIDRLELSGELELDSAAKAATSVERGVFGISHSGVE